MNLFETLIVTSFPTDRNEKYYLSFIRIMWKLKLQPSHPSFRMPLTTLFLKVLPVFDPPGPEQSIGLGEADPQRKW